MLNSGQLVQLDIPLLRRPAKHCILTAATCTCGQVEFQFAQYQEDISDDVLWPYVKQETKGWKLYFQDSKDEEELHLPGVGCLRQETNCQSGWEYIFLIWCYRRQSFHLEWGYEDGHPLLCVPSCKLPPSRFWCRNARQGSPSVLLLGCSWEGGLSPISNLEAKPCSSSLWRRLCTPLDQTPLTPLPALVFIPSLVLLWRFQNVGFLKVISRAVKGNQQGSLHPLNSHLGRKQVGREGGETRGWGFAPDISRCFLSLNSAFSGSIIFHADFLVVLP